MFRHLISTLALGALIVTSGCFPEPAYHEPEIVDLVQSKVVVHAHEDGLTQGIQDRAAAGCAIHGRFAHFVTTGRQYAGSRATGSCSVVGKPQYWPTPLIPVPTRQEVRCESNEQPRFERTFIFACVLQQRSSQGTP